MRILGHILSARADIIGSPNNSAACICELESQCPFCTMKISQKAQAQERVLQKKGTCGGVPIVRIRVFGVHVQVALCVEGLSNEAPLQVSHFP